MGSELGGVLSSAVSLGSAGIDAWAGRENAQDQMHFQKKMSNTSHAREVRDLLRAGLNPILSANSGASSPQGAAAPGTDFASSVQHLQQYSLQKQRIHKELEALEAQKQRDASAADVNDATADGIELDNIAKDKKLDNLENEAAIVAENLNLLRHSVRSADSDAYLKEQKTSPYRKYGQDKFGLGLADIEKGVEMATDVMDLLNPGRQIGRIFDDVMGKKQTPVPYDPSKSHPSIPGGRKPYKPRARRTTRENRNQE